MSVDPRIGWRFSQYFGIRLKMSDIQEPDLLSSIEFDDSGEFLATGDHGGRVVIFQRSTDVRDSFGRLSPEYHFYAEFQSHERKFDYLSSTEIPEKINSIRWVKTSSNSRLLLTSNDRTIKLWKLQERENHSISMRSDRTSNEISFPVLRSLGREVVATNKNNFMNAHTYKINSLSCFADGETFISSDDFCINLWNVERPTQSYNIVNIQPPNLESLTEIITDIACHPIDCTSFVYATSKGDSCLCDLRLASKCSPSRIFQPTYDEEFMKYCGEITSFISSVMISRNGQNLITRDYMTVRVWDMRNETEPISEIPVQTSLRSNLDYLYENDILFDRFAVTCNATGTKICTGSYQSYFQVMDLDSGLTHIYEAARKSKFNSYTNLAASKHLSSSPVTYDVRNPEFLRTISHVAWHPKEDIIALSGLNNLYIFTGYH